MELREYQTTKMIQPARLALRSHNSVVVVGPTGSGKSACMAYMCQSARRKNKKILIILHKGIIQRQVMRTLHHFGVERGGITSGKPITNQAVQVAMVGTLINRLDKIPVPDIIISDESHHVIEGNQWGRCIRYYQEHNPKLKLVGFTATPQGRTDGKGLHPFFESLVDGPTPQELTSQGWLTWPKVWNISGGLDFKMKGKDFDRGLQEEHFSRAKIIGNVIEHYRQHLDGLPTLVSCVSVKHAHEMAARYEEYARGRGLSWRAVAIQGGKKYEKKMLMALNGLASGSVQIVTFCDVIGEGVDVPVCMGLQMLRKTTSLVLYLQFVGRILRPVFSPGFNQYDSTAEQRLTDIANGVKPFAKLLDHVGNTDIHGHPMLTRAWGLADTKTGRQVGKDSALLTTMCDKCFGVWPGKPKVCPDCGADLVLQELHKQGKKSPQELAGELKEFDPALLTKVLAMQEMMPRDKQKALMRQIFEEGDTARMRAAAKALGYKPGFVRTIWRLKR